MLINRLQNHVAGKLEMSKTQIQAAGILLRKTLPDMVAQTIEKRPLEDLQDSELLETLRAIRGHLAAASAGDSPSAGVEPSAELPTVN